MLILIFLILLTVNSYAGICFFGCTDQAMQTRQEWLRGYKLPEFESKSDALVWALGTPFARQWLALLRTRMVITQSKVIDRYKQIGAVIKGVPTKYTIMAVKDLMSKWEWDAEASRVMSEKSDNDTDKAQVGAEFYAGSMPWTKGKK